MNNKYTMYHSNINKQFHNNKNIFIASSKYNNNNVSTNVKEKINELISDSSFIYRMKVNIVMDNQIISKKIIGVIGNNLITIDNEYIPIDKIQDIYK